MSLLDNIKSNFLGNRNSFNVTFNNKSPLSYVGAESIPAHGSSIKTQMEAPKVSDVYAAHSPKDYLEAETEKYHAMGDAVVSIVESLYGAAGGGGGGEGMMGGGEGGGMMDSLDTFGGGGKGKDEGPSTEEMKEKWCKDYPDSDVC
tara:strand:- start:525 stop:962 length:438 start_codon:yes stop_codon:yes gene_type:complete